MHNKGVSVVFLTHPLATSQDSKNRRQWKTGNMKLKRWLRWLTVTDMCESFVMWRPLRGAAVHAQTMADAGDARRLTMTPFKTYCLTTR